MNIMNDPRRGIWFVTVLVLLVGAGSAYANCVGAYRMPIDDAECLAGKFTNRTWPNEDTAWVRNDCSEFGTVVAKVDRAGAADWTKWLEGSSIEVMSGANGNVRGIYCCYDLSDLCNKENLINSHGCQVEFKKSPAHEETIDESDPSSGKKVHFNTITGEVEDESCTIHADVTVQDSSGNRHTRNTQTTVHYNETKNLKVCYNPESTDVQGSISLCL